MFRTSSPHKSRRQTRALRSAPLLVTDPVALGITEATVQDAIAGTITITATTRQPAPSVHGIRAPYANSQIVAALECAKSASTVTKTASPVAEAPLSLPIMARRAVQSLKIRSLQSPVLLLLQLSSKTL